ncbi:MAG: class I poly(R)-hydroxyalkanoic acid synthase [Betaproteobacteria bacterium]|nr:class I poly(R)-hydroxyalkanoic acid synthase [Betaproteobacteria bacterium]
MNQADQTKIFQDVAERSSKILGEFAQKQALNLSSAMRDEMGIAKAFMDLYARMASDPSLVASVSINWWVDSMRLWQSTWLKMLGMPAEPVAEPAKSDGRFKDEDWSKNFLFDYLKQSYLLAARHIQHAVSEVEGLPPESEKKVAFFTRQYVDALSPSNFLVTNPQVLKETLNTGGQNLVRGLNNLLSDIEKGGGELRISMTDETAFELGRNVATTPGKVVYQNDLMQLIQYEPTTAEVFKRPLVIIPPWINKYYILDLREKNSFIRWALDQGHTVFVVSWVNPDARLAQKGFDDYLQEGALGALEAVERATGERSVNFIGYCLGGTLLGAALAYLKQTNQANRVSSATFFVSLLDFSKPGELGVFIDEAQVENLERKMNERGYLEGSEMAGTFNLLRANDLVWSFVVNNYLLGKDPFPFDLLYWNSDSTRMPARMHSFYLRNMYIRNLLGVPGGITLSGVPIDLSKVELPCYFISTVEDHIAPWKTTYVGARYLGSAALGRVRFVLGGSGHIAGIVNPPSAKKYHYWTNEKLPATADEWFGSATQHPGSWWEDWQRWMEKQNAGELKVPARKPGSGSLKVIEAAPGSYAMLRLGRATAVKSAAPQDFK